jgi:hypothetical protein
VPKAQETDSRSAGLPRGDHRRRVLETASKERTVNSGSAIAIGVGVGIGIGLAAGWRVGIALGAAVGVAMRATAKHHDGSSRDGQPLS